MPKFLAHCNIPGLKIEAGKVVTLSEADAEGLERPGVLERVPAGGKKDDEDDKGAGAKKDGGDK